MADKRISQLTDRGTVANNDVVAIVVSGAVTTNKATISSIQTFMQGNLDLGVTSVGITLGSSGTDVSVTGSPITTSGNITINLPTASASNRGVLSAADFITFNSKQPAGNYVTLDTAQTITAQKTFTGSGGSDTMIISHGSGSGFALDVIKAGNGEVIRVLKTSGSGNAMTVQGGNFEAPTIVKTGGTSSQFLMADGSVNTSVLASGAYLPLSGGTLTGALNGTSGVFTSSLQSQTTVSAINSTHAIGLTANVGGFNRLETTGTGPLSLVTAGSSIGLAVAGVNNQFTLTTASLSVAVPYSGTSATLTGALNGTSAVFSGAVKATTYEFTGAIPASAASTGYIDYSGGGTRIFSVGTSGATKGTFSFIAKGADDSSIIPLSLASTGAATFTAPTEGNGTVKVNSTDAQGANIGGVLTIGGNINNSGQTNTPFGFISGRKTNSTVSNDDGYLAFGTRSSTIGTGTNYWQFISTSGAIRFLAYGAGALTTDASGNVTASSDERMKNITGFYTNGLSAIKKIKPITYKWKEETELDTKEFYTGFSAQNLHEAIPESAGIMANGDLTIQDRPIMATIVNSINELNDIILKQQEQIDLLKNQIK